MSCCHAPSRHHLCPPWDGRAGLGLSLPLRWMTEDVLSSGEAPQGWGPGSGLTLPGAQAPLGAHCPLRLSSPEAWPLLEGRVQGANPL